MSKKLRMMAAAGVLAGLTFTAVAMAGAPKFHAASSSVANDGSLVVSFDERGLGNENVDYTLTADGVATFACFNGGGKNPSAANKQDVNIEVSEGESFEPKNGRVSADLSSLAPSPGDFSCPNGQRLRLAAVSYTNIVLTDTTNGVSIGVPDASRTFFTV
jgi:hypothetical protein